MSTTDEDRMWHRTALRISGDHINLDQIGKDLGLEPSNTGKKGDFMGRNPHPGRARYETNLWVYRLPVDDSIPFEDQIPQIVDLLEHRIESFKRILSTPGCKADLFLGFSSGSGQGSAYFSPDLLKRIGNLGIEVFLDLYPPVLDAE